MRVSFRNEKANLCLRLAFLILDILDVLDLLDNSEIIV